MINSRRRGFTIVEILVVISVIAVLLSLLFVGLRSAIGTASKTRELNALRNVALGWSMYSSVNSEYLLPGYLSPEVQDAWRLDWRNAAGSTLPPEAAAPYTWRLAPYVEYSWEALMGHRADAQKELGALPIDTVALNPSFGYNALYVGGWWESVTEGTTQFEAMRYDLLADASFRGLTARTQGGMRRPSELIVFAATTEQNPGVFRNNDLGASADGFHLATPGIVAEEERWRAYQGSGISVEVLVTGPVPLVRYSSSIAVATADGGVSGVSVTELADQRRWIDIAADRTWSHPGN